MNINNPLTVGLLSWHLVVCGVYSVRAVFLFRWTSKVCDHPDLIGIVTAKFSSCDCAHARLHATEKLASNGAGEIPDRIESTSPPSNREKRRLVISQA